MLKTQIPVSHIREPARDRTHAGLWRTSRLLSAGNLTGTRFASGVRQASPEGKEPAQAEDAGRRFGFSFADIPISSAATRALSTSHRGEAIESIGPARSNSCSCGSACAKCRNPTGLFGSESEIFTREATKTRAAEIKTQAPGGGGGAGGGGVGAPAAAPPARRARLSSGPRYTPHGSLIPTVAGGTKSVSFVFDGVFDSDAGAGVFPGCGEIHQDIKWNAAAATSFTAVTGSPVPHAGFPAAHPANTWIEDRDTADTRYGRRSGAHSAPVAGGDEYTNSAGVQDMAHGATYHGSDGPTVPAALTGQWKFMTLAFDMCNHGVQVGSADFITIDW